MSPNTSLAFFSEYNNAMRDADRHARADAERVRADTERAILAEWSFQWMQNLLSKCR